MIHRRCALDPLGQIAKHCQLQVQDKQTRSLSSSTSRNFNLIQMLDVSFLGVFSCISISWVNGNSYKQEFLEEIFFLSAYEVKDTTAAYLKGFSK